VALGVGGAVSDASDAADAQRHPNVRPADESIKASDIANYPPHMLRFLTYYDQEKDKPYIAFLAAIGHRGLPDPLTDETIMKSYGRTQRGQYHKGDVIRNKSKPDVLKEVERRLVLLGDADGATETPSFLTNGKGARKKEREQQEVGGERGIG